MPDFLYLNGFLVSVSNHLNYKIDKANRLVCVTLDDNWNKVLDAKIMIIPNPNYI